MNKETFMKIAIHDPCGWGFVLGLGCGCIGREPIDSPTAL